MRKEHFALSNPSKEERAHSSISADSLKKREKRKKDCKTIWKVIRFLDKSNNKE
jgi:hypothetical protein